MDSAQSIAQKVPPVALETALDGLRTLLINNPDATDSLMKKYCIPFDHVIDNCVGDEPGEKPFVACYYNRVGDKYRSPWTNKLHPKDTSTTTSTTRRPETDTSNIRSLEISFNDVWDSYKNLYYGNESIGSVFLKESSEKGIAFQGLFGIRKRAPAGSWDSVSMVSVEEPTDKECTYRVDTYVRVVITPTMENGGGLKSSTTADISLTMSKENTINVCKVFPDKIPINVSHIENIGAIIEDSEMELRSIMETVHISKNYETLVTLQKPPQGKMISNPVMGLMIDSGALKKRLAAQQQNSTNEESVVSTEGTGATAAAAGTSASSSASSASATTTPKRPGGIPAGVNPLMAGAMNSKILLKKKQQQQQE